jgi:hypothetical protein
MSLLSVVMCSRDDARFARSSASFTRALSGVEHEIIRIVDARGMCEGYNRGIAQARGERLILAHDDVEILSDDFAIKVERRLDRFDLFGVEGTTKLIGPAGHLAGPPWVFGQMLYDNGPEKGLRVYITGLPGRTVAQAQSVDGVFIAVWRRVWEKLRFDEQTFTGWHLYDVDFSYRAHLAGFKVGIVCDLDLFHYVARRADMYQDPQWVAAAEAFWNKHKATLPPLPANWVQWWPMMVRVQLPQEAVNVMRPAIFETQDV